MIETQINKSFCFDYIQLRQTNGKTVDVKFNDAVMPM